MVGVGRNARKLRRRRARFSVAAALLSTAVVAQQAPIPQGATPGGALPRIDTLPSQSSSQRDLFSVPKVSERELGLEEGPRLKVVAFRLAGAVDRPKSGIRLADLTAILANIVQTQPENGLTVNQMQEAAGKLSDYYHQHGFVLAQAFVPAQQVQGGEVTVQVLEGKLAAVTFEGNRQYSSATLGRPFNDLLGGAVDRASIESALLTLTDYPGLSAFGVLKAGPDIGTTDLTVRVQKEERAEFSLQADNEGSPYAGEYRALASVTVNDLAGLADRLRLYGLYGDDLSSHHADGAYGGLDYTLPLFSARDAIELSASSNAYSIGGNIDPGLLALNPKGESYIGSIGYRHTFAPTRTFSSSVGVAFGAASATIKSDNSSGVETDEFRDRLTTASVDYLLSAIDTRFRGVDQLHVTFTHGFKNLLGSLGDYDRTATPPPSRDGASGDFSKVVLDLQRLQRLTKSVSLLLHVTGQYSSDPLVSLEQLPVTGPDAVRAYTVSDVLADKGVIATGEFIVAAPGFYDKPAFGGRTWGQILQFSVFGDYAESKLNGTTASIEGEARTIVLAGYGGAIQFNIPNRVFARIDVSKSLTESVPLHDPQIYFRLGFTF